MSCDLILIVSLIRHLAPPVTFWLGFHRGQRVLVCFPSAREDHALRGVLDYLACFHAHKWCSHADLQLEAVGNDEKVPHALRLASMLPVERLAFLR